MNFIDKNQNSFLLNLLNLTLLGSIDNHDVMKVLERVIHKKEQEVKHDRRNN